MIKVFVGLSLKCPETYYIPPLLRGRIHLVRATAAEKDFNIAVQMTLEYVEYPRKKKWRKKVTFNKEL